MKRFFMSAVLSIVLLGSVAFAGHTLAGTRTECPGECTTGGVCSYCGQPCDYIVQMTAETGDDQLTAPASKTDTDDFSSVALFGLLCAMVWLKLRID